MSVHLVGAGPGDPGLISVRGAALLEAADVVLHDRLIDSRLLGLARRDAIVVDVGKRPGASAGGSEQEQINEILVAYGRSARRVVRLKGGDPYVFGRGGEEALALDAAGIPYEVVPGISSAFAAPAAAGSPLTHRGVSAAVTVLSGHDLEDRRLVRHAVASGATIVVLMGVATRRRLAQRLVQAGLPPSTPVLVVERATLPTQRSQRLRLDELADSDVESPATIVVGEVARLHLAGYEDRPLAGRRVVVTRAHHQSGGLSDLLEEAGAHVIALPLLAIGPPADGGVALEDAVARLSEFAWVVFASANAVEAVFALVRDARSFGSARVAAVGSATAASLARCGIVADLVPERFVGEALVEVFPPPEAGASRRVLVPRAAVARDVLAHGLTALGWQVEVVTAYETLYPPTAPEALEALAGADAVTFTSSSSVAGFLEAAGRDRLPGVVASIGPVTTATARAAGIEVAVEAAEHTAAGLVAALAAHFGRPGAIGRGGEARTPGRPPRP